MLSRRGIKRFPTSVGRGGKNLGAEGLLEMFGLILAGQRNRVAEASPDHSWENSVLSPRHCLCALRCAPSAPRNAAGLEATRRGCVGGAWSVGWQDGQVHPWILVLSLLSYSGAEAWTRHSLQSPAQEGFQGEASCAAAPACWPSWSHFEILLGGL